jgi:drug/metabolite transporter (DMT)-like permease
MKNMMVLLAAVGFNIAAQIALRAGMLKIGAVSIADGGLIKALPAMLTNYLLWIGIISFGASFLFWIIALSRLELSFAYGFFGLTQALVPLGGVLFFHEQVSPARIAGIAVICAGIFLVSRSC